MEENKVESITEELKSQGNNVSFKDKLDDLHKKGILNKVLFGLLVAYALMILLFVFNLNNVSNALKKLTDFELSSSYFGILSSLKELIYTLGSVVTPIQSTLLTHTVYIILAILIIILVGFNIFKSKDKKATIMKSSNVFIFASLCLLLIVEMITSSLFSLMSLVSKLSNLSSNVSGLDSLKTLTSDSAVIALQNNPNLLTNLVKPEFTYTLIALLIVFIAVTLLAVYANYLSVFKNKEMDLSILVNHKKKVLVVVSAIVLVAVSVFGFNVVKNIFEKDAEIDATIEVKFSTKGYDEYGTISTYIAKYPKVIKSKNEEVKEKVEKALRNATVKLDKEKNLKNGDVVTATFEYTKPEGLKIKDEKITQQFTVEGLKKAVISINDVPEKSRERIQPLVESKIKSAIYSGDNIKLEKLKMYELPAKISDSGSMSRELRVMYIYKVNYDKEQFFSDKKEPYEYYYAIAVDEFRLDGDYATYEANVSDKKETSKITFEEFESIYTSKGYMEIK